MLHEFHYRTNGSILLVLVVIPCPTRLAPSTNQLAIAMAIDAATNAVEKAFFALSPLPLSRNSPWSSSMFHAEGETLVSLKFARRTGGPRLVASSTKLCYLPAG